MHYEKILSVRRGGSIVNVMHYIEYDPDLLFVSNSVNVLDREKAAWIS